MTKYTGLAPEGGQGIAPGEEAFRPQFHFTARRNWINDPNGLVYFQGEYHLFFQYNPQGKHWGNMCWGHAVSDDLLHWRELPVAIPQTDQMIFSGSALVDWGNVSGLGDGVAPPMLAYFTTFDASRNVQSQSMAFSHDGGRSFTHYAGNPIIDLNAADFRDPKVFYHAESAAWIMVIVLAQSHVVQFYRSTNLRDWDLAGTFGPRGATGGQWECPDLIRVAVDDTVDRFHWVLKVDVDAGVVDGGSGAQYFIGDFDGHDFVVCPELGDQDGMLVDYGPDFYAATTWSDLPVTQPGPVWIGWQSNHQTGMNYPTDPWRGAMTLPRRLFLFEEEGQLLLGQRPIAAVQDLRGQAGAVAPQWVEPGAALRLGRLESGFWHYLNLAEPRDARLVWTIEADGEPLFSLHLDFSAQIITFQRYAQASLPVASGSKGFAHVTSGRLPSFQSVELVAIFDGSLLEMFLDGGRRIYSACIFPKKSTNIYLKSLSGAAFLNCANIGEMMPTMRFSSQLK